MNCNRGTVLLLPMLIIAGASLASLFAISQGGIDALRTVVAEEDALEARAVVFGCFDELMIQLVGDPSFSATSLSIGEAVCDVIVTDLGDNNRSVVLTYTAQGITRRLEADLAVDPVIVSAVREEME